MSYSASFALQVIAAARERGIEKARGIVAQYDFAYDPAKVKRAMASEPVFLGVFAYATA